MKTLTYKILLNKKSGGGYTANVPALPGCIAHGDSIENAIAHSKKAIALYVKDLEARDEHIPDDQDTLEFSFTITA